MQNINFKNFKDLFTYVIKHRIHDNKDHIQRQLFHRYYKGALIFFNYFFGLEFNGELIDKLDATMALINVQSKSCDLFVSTSIDVNVSFEFCSVRTRTNISRFMYFAILSVEQTAKNVVTLAIYFPTVNKPKEEDEYFFPSCVEGIVPKFIYLVDLNAAEILSMLQKKADKGEKFSSSDKIALCYVASLNKQFKTNNKIDNLFNTLMAFVLNLDDENEAVFFSIIILTWFDEFYPKRFAFYEGDIDMQEKLDEDFSRVFLFPAIVERDAMIVERDARLKEHDARLKEHDARLKESDARLKESEEQRIRLAEENQKLRSELELVRGSTK
jgi:hypothetical protein